MQKRASLQVKPSSYKFVEYKKGLKFMASDLGIQPLFMDKRKVPYAKSVDQILTRTPSP